MPNRRIADVYRLQVFWAIAARLSLTVRYERFDAGASLTKAGHRSSDFVAAWLSFRF